MTAKDGRQRSLFVPAWYGESNPRPRQRGEQESRLAQMGRQVGVGVEHDVTGPEHPRGGMESELDGTTLATLVRRMESGNHRELLPKRVAQVELDDAPRHLVAHGLPELAQPLDRPLRQYRGRREIFFSREAVAC